MGRLDGGGDAKRTEAGHVGPVDKFDMLDPVAAVALAVGALCGFVAVDRGPDRAVADGVDGDLVPAAVDLGGDLVESGGCEQGFRAVAGMAGRDSRSACRRFGCRRRRP